MARRACVRVCVFACVCVCMYVCVEYHNHFLRVLIWPGGTCGSVGFRCVCVCVWYHNHCFKGTIPCGRAARAEEQCGFPLFVLPARINSLPQLCHRPLPELGTFLSRAHRGDSSRARLADHQTHALHFLRVGSECPHSTRSNITACRPVSSFGIFTHRILSKFG